MENCQRANLKNMPVRAPLSTAIVLGYSPIRNSTAVEKPCAHRKHLFALLASPTLSITNAGHAAHYQPGCAMQEKLDPVTIADLTVGNNGLTAHCRDCGHWKELEPKNLPLPPNRAVPSMEGVFKCSLCGSRNTCAMPDYRGKSNVAQPPGVGWIIPPAE